MNQPAYLLIGYYGFGNVGDDVLFIQTLRILQSVFSTQNPRFYCHEFRHPIDIPNRPALSFYLRGSILQLVKTIRSAEGVIFGGGSLFQTRSSTRSLFYYLGVILLSVLFRKPCILMGQGIGPFKYKWHLRLLKWGLGFARHLSFRDPDSRGQSDQWGQHSVRGDLSFWNMAQASLPTDTPSVVGINAIQNYSKWIPKSFSKTIRNTQYIVCHPSQDCASKEALVLAPHDFLSPTPSARFSWMVSMRYHGCIWAAQHLIPFVAIAIDPKIKALAHQLGQIVIDYPACFSEKTWADIAQLMHQERANFQELLVKNTSDLIQDSRLFPHDVQQALRL